MTYARLNNSDTWHWHPECSSFPGTGSPAVDIRGDKPTTGELCDECQDRDKPTEHPVTDTSRRFGTVPVGDHAVIPGNERVVGRAFSAPPMPTSPLPEVVPVQVIGPEPVVGVESPPTAAGDGPTPDSVPSSYRDNSKPVVVTQR